jgi:hypothetical protein
LLAVAPERVILFLENENRLSRFDSWPNDDRECR